MNLADLENSIRSGKPMLPRSFLCKPNRYSIAFEFQSRNYRASNVARLGYGWMQCVFRPSAQAVPAAFLALLFACALVFGAPTTFSAEPNLSQLIETAAKYESGQSMAALRQIEDLARPSLSNDRLRLELEAGLVRLLTSEATVEARQFACQHLATIGTEASLPALGNLLKNESSALLAAHALSAHPSPKAGGVLRNALPQLRGSTLIQVVGTLGDRRDAASVDALAQIAQSPEPGVATAAILALGKIANPPARVVIGEWRRRLNRSAGAEGGPIPEEQRRAIYEASMVAAERLVTDQDRDAAVPVYEELVDSAHPDNVRRGAFEALLQLDDDGGERRILETLRGTDALLKPVAISGMRALRSPASSEKFAAALPTLPTEEQVWLIDALAGRRDEAARAAVEASLFSTNAPVRYAAIQALGSSADVTLVPLFSKALAASANSGERTRIERALITLPRESEIDAALIAELGRSAASGQAIWIRVLARRDLREAIPAILRAAGQQATASEAFEALGSLATAEEIPVLLGSLVQLQVPDARSDAEAAMVQVLMKTDDLSRRTKPVLAALGTSADRETRSSLLRLLPSCGSPDALQVLNAARKDSDPQVRDTAIRALFEWPDAQAWDALLDVRQRAEQANYRALAFNALVRIAETGNATPDAKLFERYRTLLQTARSEDERRLILGALSGAAHPGALELALPLASEAGIKAEAKLAVKRIAESIKQTHPDAATEALKRLESP